MISIFWGVLAASAWTGVTLGPLMTALWFWHTAGRKRPRWLNHLAFLPTALAVEWVSAWLLFSAAGDDGSGPPGLGLVLIPAMFLLPLSVLGYLGALAATLIASFCRRA